MPVKSSLRLGQRGDTIVEVLIVLAILGLAIGISYRTATKSLLATREAQENSEATQLLQSQVERLYSLAESAVPAQNIYNSVAFCIDSGNTVQNIPNAACIQGSQNYNIKIVYCTLYPAGASLCNPGHLNDDTFVLTAIWPNAAGVGNDTVTLNYRIRKL